MVQLVVLMLTTQLASHKQTALPFGRSVGRSVSQSVGRSVGRSVGQSVSQSVHTARLPTSLFTDFKFAHREIYNVEK
jgi:hypothetical protein